MLGVTQLRKPESSAGPMGHLTRSLGGSGVSDMIAFSDVSSPFNPYEWLAPNITPKSHTKVTRIIEMITS